MKIKDRNIAELKPAEYNPRRLTDKQYKELRRSMEELGDLGFAVINMHEGRQNIIIAGHQRIRIAKDMGRKTFPCLEVSFDLVKEKRANLRLNKNGGEWDFDILANEFDVDDLLEVGFTEKDLRIADEGPGEDASGDAGQGEAPIEPARVLISFPPEKLINIQEHLEAIGEVDGVRLDWKPAGRKKHK